MVESITTVFSSRAVDVLIPCLLLLLPCRADGCSHCGDGSASTSIDLSWCISSLGRYLLIMECLVGMLECCKFGTVKSILDESTILEFGRSAE